MASTVVPRKEEEDYAIKPQALAPSVDTSSWPLLLKHYDKRATQHPEQPLNYILADWRQYLFAPAISRPSRTAARR